jgi:eukaryotic-like serine/threonine-protein kinase
MPLHSGTHIGPYQVGAAIGAGGMGEVFRARDARLKRDVAIKALHVAAMSDADRRSRFEREAQLLASLSHNNIAHIYGIEEADGAPVIVMELVEGPTLADRLRPGALPIDEVWPIAAQICEGLEAAHERGIVHRDLKPANIKLRPDGTVKILDFGLARAVSDSFSDASANSTTVLVEDTAVGVVLGTVAYMSPEQARGLIVDKRADIWAFGCVLYQMLTGAPPFAGESTTDILVKVLEHEPDLSKLPTRLPARGAELLHRCLHKNPKDRLRDIGDARLEIEHIRKQSPDRDSSLTNLVTPTKVRRAGSLTRSTLWFLAGAAVATGALRVATNLKPAPVVSNPPVRAVVTLPADTMLALSRGSAVALSPDGQRLVYAGRSGGKVQLYLRGLDRFDSQPIPGTNDAGDPFFSPDGRWVGFFAEGKLKKVSLAGGAPVALTDVRAARGEAWGSNDSIFITPANNSPIVRISAMGGKREPVTSLGPGELSHRWPRLLPDGSAVIFTIWNDTGWEAARIVAQSLTGGTRTTVVEGGGNGRYLHDPATGHGYLVYARSEGLLAAPFDAARLALAGQAVPVVDSALTNLSGGAHFDLSPSGTLAYVPGTSGEADRDLVWVTLDGTVSPARRVHAMGRYWTLAPDGERVVWINSVGPARDVWIDDLKRGTTTRVTSGADAFVPIWSPDGKSVIFARGTPANLYRRRIDSRDAGDQIMSGNRTQMPTSVSPDESTLAYTEFDPISGSDIWLLTLPASRDRPGSGSAGPPAKPFVKTNYSEGSARFSPDGRWLAYQSNESGRFEVYVRSFPGGEQVIQISTDGGLEPMWSSSGREIVYRGTDGKMRMAALVTTPSFEVSGVRILFDSTEYENIFAISPDGRRLLMMRADSPEQAPRQILLIVNFIAELRQRLR